jgi:hypothetical protein
MNQDDIFQCSECGMHYREKLWVEACEAFCKRNQACSLDIAQHAVENEANS